MLLHLSHRLPGPRTDITARPDGPTRDRKDAATATIASPASERSNIRPCRSGLFPESRTVSEAQTAVSCRQVT